MDILTLVVDLVSGGVGGNVAGAGLKDKSLGVIGNSIAGAIGGTAGAYIMKAVGVLSEMGLADATLASVASTAGISAVAGGILTFLVGYIKNSIK